MWFCRAKRKGIDIARSFERKIDAEIWEKQIISAIDEGTFKREDWIGEHGSKKILREAEKAAKNFTASRIPARDITFGEALQKYSETVSIKKKGVSQEQSKINKWRRDPLAIRPLKDLDSADFAAWRDTQLSQNVAPKTIRNYLAIVSNLFNIARREWRIKLDNPITDVSKPQKNNARDRRLSQEELQFLLDALENPGVSAGRRKNKYVLPIFLFANETAMRQSEILKLEWQHINTNDSTAWLFDTKNGDDAYVPLSPKALEIIKSMQEQDMRKTRGTIFPTTASALKQSFARAKQRAIRNYKAHCAASDIEPDANFLENYRFHDSRHEATSSFFEYHGLDMMEVSTITRHKDLRMLKRYTHLKATNLAKKMRR